MRHYEIVFMIHPDNTANLEQMMDVYRNFVQKDSGNIHRFENWGRHQLAYPIANLHKAHYVLMNIECNPSVIEEINEHARYNNAILRRLIILKDDKVTEKSAMLVAETQKTIEA